ncbi:MAG: HAMP domain-containing sensor histidine kinase [Bacteroidales bacterium]|nr:HAMP domain-containing sensor histidine kinase [Bacteroidales bacterium]
MKTNNVTDWYPSEEQNEIGKMISLDEHERLLKQKNLLISILSHDLNNSFNALLLLSRKVSTDEELPERLKKPLKTIRNSAERAYSILSNIREWSKMAIGYGGEKLQITNLSEIVDPLLLAYKDKTEEKSITIDISFSHLNSFLCNKAQLFSILRNLISNAIKFSHENSTIKIISQEINDRIEISIQDFGIGIDPVKLKTIFSPDAIEKSIGTNEEPGLGFGLLLTKELLVNNNGQINCVSQLNEGSTFTISFPIQK